eukprot:g8409.t1
MIVSYPTVVAHDRGLDQDPVRDHALDQDLMEELDTIDQDLKQSPDQDQERDPGQDLEATRDHEVQRKRSILGLQGVTLDRQVPEIGREILVRCLDLPMIGIRTLSIVTEPMEMRNLTPDLSHLIPNECIRIYCVCCLSIMFLSDKSSKILNESIPLCEFRFIIISNLEKH